MRQTSFTKTCLALALALPLIVGGGMPALAFADPLPPTPARFFPEFFDELATNIEVHFYALNPPAPVRFVVTWGGMLLPLLPLVLFKLFPLKLKQTEVDSDPDA